MLHRLEFYAMGCQMLAVVDTSNVPHALHQVPDWFESWEQVLSRFQPESELSRLNGSVSQPVRVSDTLWDVFCAALTAEAQTGGLVTPTVLDALLQAGYDRSFDILPRQQTCSAAPVWTAASLLDTLAWDTQSQTISRPSGVHLDMGGIAKGWAAHQAMERLKESGPALMDCGGDIAISGAQVGGAPWPLGVSDPFMPDDELEVLYVESGGVATSGTDRRRWQQNGVIRHHIIDPRTGNPAETDVMSATVVAPNVMQAEAAAKAALILGAEQGIGWIETQPELAGLLVLYDGRRLYSQSLRRYLD